MIRMLEHIERHLERVRSIEAAKVVNAGNGPDLAHHERELLAAFERAEASGEHTTKWIESCLATWLDEERGVDLGYNVEELHWELLAGFGDQFDADARKRLIDWVLIDVASFGKLDEQPPSRPMQIWLERLSERLLNERLLGHERERGATYMGPWQVVSRYCERLGLVSMRPAAPRLRLPGRTWLRLNGLDRLHWLMALEIERASGETDPWFASASQWAKIVRNAGLPVIKIAHADLPEGPGIFRWAALGALDLAWDGKDVSRYELSPGGRQLVSRAHAETRELFRDLARAQIQDDRREALDGDEKATDRAATTMRHARLVAHEVRNALLPVRHALNKVWKTLDGTELGERLAEPHEQIEQGISRLYNFVEASARMSAPIDDLPASFAVLEAIEEARRTLAKMSGGVRVATIPGTATPRCSGHRGRFVLVLLNIMRNAIQAAGPTVELSITVDATDPDKIEVAIEDDGPGIPEAARERLFENGTSSQVEGTGHGLALVREVVEQELGGTVVYAPGSAGGARFVLGLPSTREPTP